MTEREPRDPEVQALVDRAAIREVVLRYAQGLDRRNFDLLASCFTPDVRAAYAGRELEPGREAILARIRSHHRQTTTHLVANLTVEVRGDEADAETYTVAFLVTGGAGEVPPRVFTRGLRYHDHFVRREGRWQIDRRVHTVDWMTEGPWLPPGTPVPNSMPPATGTP